MLPRRLAWLVALPLLVAGTVGADLVGTHAEPGAAQVSGRLSLERARVDGDLAVTAQEGALHVRGPVASVVLRADVLRVTVVRVDKQYVENPLGNDVSVVAGAREERHEFRGATLALARTASSTLLYAFRDSGEGEGRFRASLGAVRGQPFRPTAEDVVVEATEADQPYGFGHTVAAPAFGVGSAALGAPFDAPLRSFRATGEFRLLLDHVAFHASDDHMRLHVEVGATRTPHASVASLTPAYEARRSYALVEVEGGDISIDLAGVEAGFLALRPSYDLDGRLEIPDSSGALRVGDATRAVAAQPVELVGRLRVVPVVSGDGSGLLGAGRSEEAPVAGTVEADADVVRVGGRPIPLPLPPSVREASLVALVAGALLAAAGALPKTSPPLLVLYTRLRGRDLLDHRPRLALYERVAREPFVHLRELERATGLGFGTVAYHVALLKRERFLASVRTGRGELLYVPGSEFPPQAMRSLSLLADPTRLRLARALVLAGPAGQEALAASLGLSRGVLSRHLAKLVRAGLCTVAGARNKRYRPTPLLETWLAVRGDVPVPQVPSLAGRLASGGRPAPAAVHR